MKDWIKRAIIISLTMLALGFGQGRLQAASRPIIARISSLPISADEVKLREKDGLREGNNRRFPLPAQKAAFD